MGNDATKQRGTHTNNIKGDILSYLQPSNTESLGYSVPLNLSKEERGLHHHGTARFLIPRRCLEDFEKDPARYVAGPPLSTALTELWLVSSLGSLMMRTTITV